MDGKAAEDVRTRLRGVCACVCARARVCVRACVCGRQNTYRWRKVIGCLQGSVTIGPPVPPAATFPPLTYTVTALAIMFSGFHSCMFNISIYIYMTVLSTKRQETNKTMA